MDTLARYRYWPFELRIRSAILGERRADEWPPRYVRWSAAEIAP